MAIAEEQYQVQLKNRQVKRLNFCGQFFAVLKILLIIKSDWRKYNNEFGL